MRLMSFHLCRPPSGPLVDASVSLASVVSPELEGLQSLPAALLPPATEFGSICFSAAATTRLPPDIDWPSFPVLAHVTRLAVAAASLASDAQLEALLQRLPRLQCLHLTKPVEQALPACVEALPSLRRLELEYLVSGTPGWQLDLKECPLLQGAPLAGRGR